MKRFFFTIEQLDIYSTSDCKERGAECSYLNPLCVCHCNLGYIMKNGHCLQGKIMCIKIDLSSLLDYHYQQTCNQIN